MFSIVLILIGILCWYAEGGWIDFDTPVESMTMVSLKSGIVFDLLMSDEFEVEGRSFADGDDPMWTAELHSDDAMTSAGYGSMHYYNHTQVTTNDGCMNITTSSDKTLWRGYNPYEKRYEDLFKNFKSGMVSSWNKFCFTGGIIEMRAILPGVYDVGGLWPAFWLLGNLGRATYEISTNLIWPWSYEECSRDLQLAQEISGCNVVKHFGLNSKQGRGSTEIDILEVMPGKTGYPEEYEWDTIGLPYLSSSLQIAPGIQDNRPEAKKVRESWMTWYDGMSYGPNTTENFYFYGLTVGATLPLEPVYRSEKQSYNADGISSISSINESHFTDFHTYKLEWQPGSAGGYLTWYMDDVMLFEVTQESLDPFGSQIPAEPSYVIFNTAVASSWGFPIPCPSGCDCSCYDCDDPTCACSFYAGFCESLPAYFMIDYVRVYQNKNDSLHTQTCDPISHPTKRFIEAHSYRYLGYSGDDPLKEIVVGGGSCTQDSDCGFGSCSSGWTLWKTCSCENGWVGPNCLVSHKFDDVVYHEDIELIPAPLAVPILLQVLGISISIAVVSATIIIGSMRSKQKSVMKADNRRPMQIR